MSYERVLPEATRLRARAMGAEGLGWLAGLDAVVEHLQGRWGARFGGLHFGGVLQGGSESLVLAATLGDGRAAVAKIGLPAYGGLAAEARVYRLSKGRGYARLFEYDAASNALLLERLGPPLRDACDSTDAQMKVLCETLCRSWIPLDHAHGLMTGAEKARWLADFIEEKWRELGEPCARRTRDLALFYAQARAGAFVPADAVLVHGDAHVENTLVVPGSGAGGDLRCKFVDPDGLFAERACDLAVPMREWSGELLAGDTVRLAVARCELLANLTGVDPEAIWQWGYMERVSTGLTMVDIGMREEGLESLAVADRLIGAFAAG